MNIAAQKRRQKLKRCRSPRSAGTLRKSCAGRSRNFAPDAAIASSFGAEDVVLIDIAARVRPDIRVFTLDTDFLFAETYELIDKIEKKYGIRVERVKSLVHAGTASRAVRGPKLWTIDPNQCCSLRKVEPLKAKLADLTAWATGIRRDQAATRANAKKIEWDKSFGLVKCNPLADWTWDQRLGIHSRPRRALQPAARAKLSEHRLRPVHAPGAARRRSARGPLVWLCEKGMRAARAGVDGELHL